MLTVPSFGQDTQTQDSEAVQQRRAAAMGLIRTINTVEATYHSERGSYAGWDLLVTTQQFEAPRVAQRMARYYQLPTNTQFTNGPEILPGLFLRLNVTINGQAYDLMLQEKPDACSFVAFTNESGVIWLAKALGRESDKKN